MSSLTRFEVGGGIEVPEGRAYGAMLRQIAARWTDDLLTTGS